MQDPRAGTQVGTNFADKRQSLGWHSSLTEIFFYIYHRENP
jgi:hypothetical protein